MFLAHGYRLMIGKCFIEIKSLKGNNCFIREENYLISKSVGLLYGLYIYLEKFHLQRGELLDLL